MELTANYKASCLGGHVFQRWGASGLFNGPRLLMLMSANCWWSEIFLICSNNVAHACCPCSDSQAGWRDWPKCSPKIISHQHIQLLYQYQDHLRGGEHTFIDLFTPKSRAPDPPRAANVVRLEVKRGPPAHQGSAYSSPTNGSICNRLLKKSLTVCGGRRSYYV